jgi:hypothetical protein
MKPILLLLALLAVSPVAAQSTADPEQPQFYMWDAPSGMVDPAARKFSRMVIVNIVGAETPEAAAQLTAQTFQEQLDAGQTDPDHLCVLLQNFGLWLWWDESHGVYDTRSISFIDPADVLDNPPSWPDPNDPHIVNWQNLQPWFRNVNDPDTGGFHHCAEWMAAYLAAYYNQTYIEQATGQSHPLPVPARFHFDSEWGAIGCCELVWTRVMQAVARDGRWGTMEVFGNPDPGNPGHDKSMQALYEEAITLYGWNPNLTLDVALNPSGGTDHVDNRPFYLWYSQVCQRAADAAMNLAAYQQIKSFTSPAGSWAGVKVSNYAWANTDGAQDTFGWYAGGPLVGGYRAPIDQCVRGQTDTNFQGAIYDWIVQNSTSRVWFTVPGVNSGDFEAPPLYTYHPDHWAIGPEGPGTGLDRRDFYLNDLATNTWPALDSLHAHLYNNRRLVESILNTDASAAAATRLSPWLPVAGDTIPYPGAYPYSLEEMRAHLAMLRAKKCPEVLLWWRSGQFEPDWWNTLVPLVDQVYRPKLTAYKRLTGVEVTSFPPPPGDPLDRFRYTLKQEPRIAVFTSRNLSGQPTVAVQFDFDVSGAPQSNLNFEGWVSDPGVYGRIYTLQNTGDWLEQPIYDWNHDGPQPGFGFFAPASANGTHETRRTFEGFGPQAPATILTIKIVFQRFSGAGTFTAGFDLVQLVGNGSSGGGGTGGGDSQGADYDYSRSVNIADTTAFLDDWLAGENAADLNQDGLIDAQDFLRFQSMLP